MRNTEIVERLLLDIDAYRDNIMEMLASHPEGIRMGITYENMDVFLAYDGTSGAKNILLDVLDTSIVQKTYWTGWFNGLDSSSLEEALRYALAIDKLLT